MPTYLQALAIENFRGIGPLQKISPFSDFNLFIGRNNSGKSTVLEFLFRYLGKNKEQAAVRATDRHAGTMGQAAMMAIGIPQDLFLETARKQLFGEKISQTNLRNTSHALVNLLADGGMVWIKSGVGPNNKLDYLARPTVQSLELAGIEPHALQTLWNAVTNRGRGDLQDNWIPETLEKFLRVQSLSFPDVKLISAKRQIGPRGEGFSDYTGRGLIDRLAEIQSPDFDMRHEAELFKSINSFLRTVLERDHVHIEVPHNREHILVHLDKKVLPLSSLGTGIHEVVLIAAFCTLSENQIVCIEEPELHLHPALQRQLISYLQQQTSNQYFVATHSASFIDTAGASIFHVENDGVRTSVNCTTLRSERLRICTDLGARASDIVQANSVIWVEGPSDRVYVNYWIKAVDSTLVEGIHYSIMFYGGRLLSHLTANDDDVSEFIGLRALNQNLAILVDSDKASPEEPVNATKARIASELDKNPGLVWITKGREIENYIDYQVIQNAVKEAHPKNYGKPLHKGDYKHVLHYKRSDSPKIATEVDKVKVARIVCQGSVNLDVLDLRERIGAVVKMIQVANR